MPTLPIIVRSVRSEAELDAEAEEAESRMLERRGRAIASADRSPVVKV